MNVYLIDIFYFRFVSTIHIDLYFITSLYQMCQSLVMIECYILMLYHNCITLIYMYLIALYDLFVFYVQRRRTLRFGAI